MNIQQMRYFAEVGRFQNITKAAEQLHIAQPTLSIAMHALEEETNLNLFRRVGRNIVLTKDGEHLLEKVNRLLMSIDRFDDEVKEMSHQRNYIRIGMPSQIAVPVMPLLLGRFREQHPDIDLEIIEESGMRVVEMVRREEVDLTIFHHLVEDTEGLTYRKLADWPLCLAVNVKHPLADRETVTLEEAVRQPLVLLQQAYVTTRYLMKKIDARHIEPNVLHYTPHMSTMWNLVHTGTCCAIMSANARMADDNQICLIPITPSVILHGCIVTKKGRQLYEDEKKLIRFLQTEFQSQDETL